MYITFTQDSQISAIANGSLLSETLFSTANDNLGVVSGYPGFLQSIKGNADLHPSSLYDHHMNSADGDVSWLKADKFGSRPDEGSLQFLQKRSRNIGSKSRRFLMDAEDAMELKLTWEEAQELLRPAPTAKPTIVTSNYARANATGHTKNNTCSIVQNKCVTSVSVLST